MFRKMKAGETSQSVPIFIQDTSSLTGAGLGSLVFNTSGLAAKYRRQGQSSWTTISLVTMTVGTWASGGFVADGGPVTGGYEFGIPDACLASGAGVEWVQIFIYGATNMLPVLLYIELDQVNYQDAAAFGLSRVDVAVSTRLASGSYTAPDNTTIANIYTVVDTEVAAIKAKTDNLPTDPADASDIAASFTTVNTTLSTIAGYIDTEVAAIKAKTDNLPASPAAVGSAMTLANGAITAAVIATGAIDADALAADAGQEIAAALLDATLTGHTTADTVGRALQIARAQGKGKWSISGDTLTLYDVDNTTVVGTFTLAPASGPYTSRTATAE